MSKFKLDPISRLEYNNYITLKILLTVVYQLSYSSSFSSPRELLVKWIEFEFQVIPRNNVLDTMDWFAQLSFHSPAC